MNSNDSESFGRIVRKALFIGIRAAWKSIECGMEASLTRRIRTKSPSRTRTTGPGTVPPNVQLLYVTPLAISTVASRIGMRRSEEHTSELQSRLHLVCRLLLEKKKNNKCADDTRII